VQLAALALPAHPAALRLIVETLAVQEMKSVDTVTIVAGIQPVDFFTSEGEQVEIGF
jgi:hypothetical protein